MAKLWQKGYELDAAVEALTVGDDYLLDNALIKWDAAGSVAHARMLGSIGVLTPDEVERLRAELSRVIELGERGEFKVARDQEDVHTAVENHLVEKLGDLGKKLHAARSRNDQVILDLRLYMRDRYAAVAKETLDLAASLAAFAKKHADVPIPGRTHFQRAMPSSAGLWAGAFVESLLDDLDLFAAVIRIADQCPLGSAASYGVNLNIDRQMVADLLGFASVQNNVLYVNNSRGKVEAMVLSACAQIMNDLSKLSADVILWTMPEFGYFSLPAKFCPGSSLMPQKRNPCPFELVRAKAAETQANLIQALEISRPLISGYHREFQLTKGPLMRGLDDTLACLQVIRVCVEEMGVNPDACVKAFTPELFATDRALNLVKQGVPFRDAYRQVAATIGETALEDPVANIKSKTHLGATGNLGLNLASKRIEEQRAALAAKQARWEGAIEKLLAG